MKFLSVCSGIEAASVAWHPLGWESVAYSEIEPFPCKVLQHHYPDVPNLGDMTKFKEWNLESNVDVFVGGTPCQSFSVAGLRKGLDDPRGNLMLVFLAIAKQYRPNWLVWENVPGVLSSADGRDFGSFLGGLAILGYGFAYRVLDAQYFGVAQRRRRVFVVGYLGNWRPAAAVLFERESLSGNPAPCREKGKGFAASIASGAPISDYDVAGTLDKGVPGRGIGHNGNYDSQVVSVHQWPADVSSTLDTTFGTKMGLENQHVNAGCPMFVPAQPIPFKETADCLTAAYGTKWNGNASADNGSLFVAQPIALAENTIGRKPENGGNGDGFTDGGPMYTLNASGVHGVAQPIAFDAYNQTTSDTVTALRCAAGGVFDNTVAQSIIAPTLTAANDPSRSPQSSEVTQQVYSVLQASMAVRRLTPIECERLQGFGDNYTDIQANGKATPDGPRYKALGNSMAVPVMAWIGKRIQEVDALL